VQSLHTQPFKRGHAVEDKDKSKKTKGDGAKSEKSKTDVWRDLERAAQIAEAAAAEARRCADQIGSDIARELIEQHKGAAVELDGQMYTPKKRASREVKDSEGKLTVKAPKLPYQLVRYAPKSSVEI
jgi:hypothetical protein